LRHGSAAGAAPADILRPSPPLEEVLVEPDVEQVQDAVTANVVTPVNERGG
jgi:hypothetical protein